jgi:hypothetical protein
MIAAGVRIDIPIDASRYRRLLSHSAWREETAKLAGVYAERVIYEGPVGGLRAGRVIELTAGDSTADVRLVIDAVPNSLTMPVLAAGRAAALAFGTPASDRQSLLARVALLIYLVEPTDDAEVPRPDRPVFGLAAALRLMASPVRPHVWAALRASLDIFEPSLVLDLRDGGAALSAQRLAYIVHARGQQTETRWFDEQRARIGADEGQRTADEIRRRGIALIEPGADELHTAGMLPLAPGVMAAAPGQPPDRTLAAWAAHTRGVFGATAVAMGQVESERAASLAGAAGAAFITGPAVVEPERV